MKDHVLPEVVKAGEHGVLVKELIYPPESGPENSASDERFSSLVFTHLVKQVKTRLSNSSTQASTKDL